MNRWTRRGTVALALAAALAAVGAPTASGSGPAPGTTSPVLAEATGRPSAATTGVPSGAVLRPMAGGIVNVSNTVISNVVIDGFVRFTGSNLTLRNVRITGKGSFRGDDLVIEDSELGALNLSGTDGVRVSRVEVTGDPGSDGIHITSDTGQVRDVVISDTWVHDPQVVDGSHYDGMQVRGVDGLTLRRVLIELGDWKPQFTAALFLETANGGNRHVTVDRSWILGGGYAFYSFADDVRITDSVFGGARWGHLYPPSDISRITAFSGNVDTAGTPLALRPREGANAFAPAGSPGTVADVVPAEDAATGEATAPTSYAQVVASPDLTGDRAADVVTVDGAGVLRVHHGRGDGSVGTTTTVGPGWSRMRVFAPGNWDGRGGNDLVAADADGRLLLYRGDGRGGVAGRDQIGHGWTGYRIVPAGDVDGDRDADLLAIDPGHRLWLYPGDGSGGFARRVQVGYGWRGFELYAAGDMNRDGRADILSVDGAGRLWFYAGKGRGFFHGRTAAGHGWTGYEFASGADLDGNRVNDLLGRDPQGRLWFYSGRTGGSFATKRLVASGW